MSEVQNNIVTNEVPTRKARSSSLSVEQIDEIISRRKSGEPGTFIAKSMGLHATTVYRYLREAGIGRSTGFTRASVKTMNESRG